MLTINYKGVLFYKGETQKLGSESRPFYKREFVVEVQETDGKYPHTELVKAFLTGDHCKWLDSYNEGTFLSVAGQIRGSKWQSKKTGKEMFFTEIVADWISSEDDADTTTYTQNVQETQETQGDEDDDLPF